jgi:lysozyme
MKEELSRQLRGDEDERPCVYKDSLGFWTIGVGRLVDERKPGSGLSPDEITYLLNNDIDDRAEAVAKALPWFQSLDEARQGVLLNMAFQLGTEGLLKFERTLGLIEARQYEAAADAMLRSLWATQTPKRAKRMAEQMRSGQWQYAA